MKTALVCGAGGFIGSHLVKRLKQEGYWVRGVDLKNPVFSPTEADDFIVADLRDPYSCERAFRNNKGIINYDEVYQLAADMGGAGYIFSGKHDANVMHNSALVNLNMVELCRRYLVKKVFYSSSACIYPKRNQMDPDNPKCSEDSAYPAEPDSEYGWEKLFSERLYKSYERNHGLNVRIARFHNIFGPEGAWDDGREKAPAALCRKVAEAPDVKYPTPIKVWGTGKQTRSFLYVAECLEGIRRLMRSDCTEIINIGSEEMISINDLALMIGRIAQKTIKIQNVPGEVGVQGRNSDNALIRKHLDWAPSASLEVGIRRTYEWIDEMVHTGG